MGRDSPAEVLPAMQHIVFVIVTIVGLLLVDTFGFHNRYGSAAWAEAKYEGQKFQYGIEHWLNRKLHY